MNEKMSEIISNLTIVSTIPYVVLLLPIFYESETWVSIMRPGLINRLYQVSDFETRYGKSSLQLLVIVTRFILRSRM